MTALYSSIGEPADYPDARFCPRCGTSLTGSAGFVQEYWVADDTVYFCWCHACHWRGEVKAVTRVYGVEPEESSSVGAAQLRAAGAT